MAKGLAFKELPQKLHEATVSDTDEFIFTGALPDFGGPQAQDCSWPSERETATSNLEKLPCPQEAMEPEQQSKGHFPMPFLNGCPCQRCEPCC